MFVKMTLLFDLVLAVLYMYTCIPVLGRNTFDNMFAASFSYTTNEIGETRTSQSHLSCARRCHALPTCAAFEFQEDNSTCVILKSATLVSQSSNKTQFVKQVEGSYGVSNYTITDIGYNGTECTSVCETLGGHLASLQSQGESTFIHKLRTNRLIWIGGKSTDGGTTWAWDNGEPWGFTDWANGEPNTIENYLCAGQYNAIVGWDDYGCWKTRRCVCETDMTIG